MNKPITLCERCDKKFPCLLDFDGKNCRRERTVEPSNADRIRAMTDEELAELLNPTASCTDCPVDNRMPCGTDGRSCRDRVLDWLRQEVADEHYHSWG